VLINSGGLELMLCHMKVKPFIIIKDICMTVLFNDAVTY